VSTASLINLPPDMTRTNTELSQTHYNQLSQNSSLKYSLFSSPWLLIMMIEWNIWKLTFQKKLINQQSSIT